MAGHHSLMSNDTRETILRRATALLDERGSEAVTLRALGDAIGLSRQAPYRHFHDKTALLAGVAAKSFQELEANLAAALSAAEASGHDALELVMLAFVDWALRHPRRYELMISPALHENAELVATAQSAYALFAEGLARRIGAQPDPTTTAAIFALAHGVVDLAISGLFDDKGLEPDKIVRRLLPAS